MLKRLKHMLVKEILQLLRDPRMRIIVFGVPVIQLTIFAFALTTDVTNIKTAVLDLDVSHASRELLRQFTSSGYFEVSEYLSSPSQIPHLLDSGEVRVVLHVPAGYANRLAGGQTAAVCSGAYCLSSNIWNPPGSKADCGGLGWIISPDGDILAETDPDAPFATVAVDLEYARLSKTTYPRYVPE